MKRKVPIKVRLWDVFQNVVGGNRQKKEAIRENIRAPGKVLEIGCATGNVAEAFGDFDYVGVDLDMGCIALARRKFPQSNYRFYCLDILEDDLPEAPDFHFVLISHTAHHLPDDYMKPLIRRSSALLREGGELMILDMVRPEPWAFRKQFYYRLDRGRHFRSIAEFRVLFAGESCFEEPRFDVVKTAKLGVEVIDGVVIRAKRREREPRDGGNSGPPQ